MVGFPSAKRSRREDDLAQTRRSFTMQTGVITKISSSLRAASLSLPHDPQGSAAAIENIAHDNAPPSQ
jgi:hypothetical protein